MTKAQAGRLGGQAGNGEEKCARMRAARKKKIEELGKLLYQAREERDAALKGLAEARQLAWEYRWDIRQLVGEHQWEGDWKNDVIDHPWLPERWENFDVG